MTWLKRLTFKRRIWLSFIIVITLAIAVTGLLAYYIAASTMKDNAVRSSVRTLNTASQLLDEKLKRTMVTVMSMMVSDPYKRAVLQDAVNRNRSQYYTHLSAMENVFSQARINEPLIHSILITTPIGDFFSLYANRRYDVPFMETEMYDKIQASDKPYLWIEGHEDPLFGDGERVITLVMEVLAEPVLEDAYIVVNIKEQALAKEILQNLKGEYEGIYLMNDATGRHVWEPSKESARWPVATVELAELLLRQPTADGVEHADGGEDYLINFSPLSVVEGWTLVGVQSKDALLSELGWIQWATILVIGSCVLIALIVSNLLTGFLLKPLHKLQTLMVKVSSSDLSVRFKSDYEDEVTQVGMRFNRMLDEINGLIEEVREVEHEKRKAEIKSLSAQIDPHFLYNALNTVYWKSQLNRQDDVRQMVLSLSQLFQLGLNKGNEITTLEKELVHVEQYLTIQQLCYEDLFVYKIEVADEGLRDLPMLRVILQPLVENSILHGFKKKQEGGRIDIRVSETEAYLELSVIDNGSGMDVESVYRDMRLEDMSDKGYALRNVYHRLKLYYGESAEVLLSSEPEVRTAVTLIIPSIQLRNGGTVHD